MTFYKITKLGSGSSGTRLRMTLLSGVSLLAVVSVVLLPQPTNAQACPQTNVTVSCTGGLVPTGSVSITSSGTIGGGINNSDSIGFVDNDGSVTGNLAGIDNTGTIGTIENSGGISGDVGIGNGGSIGLLSNDGNVTGQFIGIDNVGAAIGALTNDGTISGNSSGIANSGAIVTLTNNGKIYAAGTTGVNNQGSIGTLTNTGSIDGHTNGLDNFGSIGTLNNTGTISAQVNGIFQGGEIGTLSNNGTITSNEFGISNSAVASINFLDNGTDGVISGGIDGINNSGSIDTLTNIGVIEGKSTTGLANEGNLGTLSNGTNGQISGGGIGIDNDGSLNVLTNSGAISGGVEGIDNSDSIGTLANTGLISGGKTGIINTNVITALSNSGTITSNESGIVNSVGASINFLDNGTDGVISGGIDGINNSGSIDALTNVGVIEGKSTTGLANEGNLGTLSNGTNGQISGGGIGIDNDGSLNVLTNSGVISGGIEGIDNSDSIGTLANTGLISGGKTGIINTNALTALSNSGTISGVQNGINNDGGALETIANSGTIIGQTGINLSDSTGTTIINSGLIKSTDDGNAILLGDQTSHLILTTGSVIDGTIDGGGSASQIALDGTGTLTSDITNFGAGSTLDVAPEADWTASGNWTIANVTNNGMFQAGVVGTPLNLIGNYTQTSTGTLRVVVTPTASSQFNITGAAALAGTVNYNFAPGSYSPTTHAFLTATNGVTGTFTSEINSVPAGFTSSIPIPDSTTFPTIDDVDLILTKSFVIAPSDDSIFSAQSQALATDAQQTTSLLLDKAVLGGNAGNETCAAAAQVSPASSSPNGVNEQARLASALGSGFCQAGGWIEATGSFMNAGASGGASGYSADTAGFMAGLDRLVDTSGTRLGFAIGYDQIFLNDDSGGSGSMGVTHLALYGSQPVGPITLAGVFGYGQASNTTSRATGVGNLSESNNNNIISGGVQASTNVSLGQFALLPEAGLRVASVSGGDFAESGQGFIAAFAVSGRTANYTSVQPYVTLGLSRSFTTASHVVISPDVQIGYEYEAEDRGVATEIFSADGTAFSTAHNNLDPSDGLLSAGLSAGKNNWSLYADYKAQLSGNWTAQTVEAGLRVTF
jgi:uncharacterized protein with beta-barrel porin domain